MIKKILSGTADSDKLFRCNDKRPDIEGGAFLVRYPISIHIYHGFHRFRKNSLRQRRNAYPPAGDSRPLFIHIGPEKQRSSVRGQICFHALKHFLGIMKHGGSRIQADGSRKVRFCRCATLYLYGNPSETCGL
jgi:hypothetical protein